MPPFTRQIAPNLIILLRILKYLHIDIYNNHTLRSSTKLTQRSDKRHSDLRQAYIPFPRRTTRISKHDSYTKNQQKTPNLAKMKPNTHHTCSQTPAQ